MNIILGKFQPLTIAHKQLIEELYNQNHKKVIIVLTKSKVVDEKHPFSQDLILKELFKVYPNNDIVFDIITHSGGDFGPLFNYLYKVIGNDLDLWGCGTDRVEAYRKFIKNPKYIEMFHLPETFDVYELKRTDENISATKVRQFIKDNDFENFKQMMPEESWQFFEEFKKELDKVSN
jgi:nicotinic acid mononucleotide adenylyltransferase